MSLAERLGFAAGDRVLILHADDAASTHAANAAIFECLAAGSLTSASILVPAPWFHEAAAYARAHPEADFGLHLTLTAEYDALRYARRRSARPAATVSAPSAATSASQGVMLFPAVGPPKPVGGRATASTWCVAV